MSKRKVLAVWPKRPSKIVRPAWRCQSTWEFGMTMLSSINKRNPKLILDWSQQVNQFQTLLRQISHIFVFFRSPNPVIWNRSRELENNVNENFIRQCFSFLKRRRRNHFFLFFFVFFCFFVPSSSFSNIAINSFSACAALCFAVGSNFMIFSPPK
jgi:hypothetical protein